MSAPDCETILVLSAGFGEGHNSAARNLAAALAAESGGRVNPVVLDPFTAAAPNLSAFMKWGYQLMTNRMPGLWQWLYESTRHGDFGHHVWDRFVGLMHWLEEKLAEVRPETVVMTYPLYAAFLPGLNAAVPRPRRVYVAVTDSITIHPIWTAAPADRWFVTDERSREVVLKQGIAPEKCLVTGFATAARFASGMVPPEQRSGVLYFATTGTRHVKQTLAGLLRDLPPEIPLTIVTGRHEARLRPVLEKQIRLARSRRVEVLGWCGNIPALMAGSQLILTKAGGATVHECFAAGVPAVINYVIPGQEEGNARLLELTGCGCRSEDPALTGALLRELFHGGGLAAMTTAMETHRRPDGAVRMAREILAGQLAGVPRRGFPILSAFPMNAPGFPQTPALRDDPWLAPWLPDLDRRAAKTAALREQLTGGRGTLAECAVSHDYYGLHLTGEGWVFREWAPNATALYLVGDHSDWQEVPECAARRLNDGGDWELTLPGERLRHGAHYRLSIHWPGGRGDRIPAWVRRVVQDPHTHLFSAQVWNPPPWQWKHARPDTTRPPLIYEAHAGMAQEEARVATWVEFKDRILPRIAAAGYNTVQLMGAMEHPYYGSFGYHVSSFFAPSSRFGTPEEFKDLIDTAHGMGLSVIIDLVHSHSVKNEGDGLARFDGTPWQYFHDGARGHHPAWDSRCFDYRKPGVLRFLLSNCRYWVEEYRLDGFRFDGVTSMIYADHGLGKSFTGYGDYFHPGVDEDALSYLALANEVIHEIHPGAFTIAEDVSGMPGLGASAAEGGAGFDYRLAMGIPDIWATLASKVRDEDWNVEHLYHELTTRRAEEKVIAYVESHDQAIVGGQTFISRLLGPAIYTGMARHDASPVIVRGLALWKTARLLTLATAGHGYLNFMGNEFGHPEWIDFPREGNHWSCHYARRQWSLRDNPALQYHALGDFDAALMGLLGVSGFLREPPVLLYSHVSRQHLVFHRSGFLFVVSLHPSESHAGCAVPCPAGTWELVLHTDEARFAGPDRLAPGQSFHSRSGPHGGPEISVYLPSRCAMILRRAGG